MENIGHRKHVGAFGTSSFSFAQVRFSPLMTLPTTVKITAPDFATKLAWSQLPGSIISVPAGHSISIL